MAFAQDGQRAFRAMLEGPDGFPAVGNSARKLGVRVNEPAPVDGFIVPLTGGMSVALDDPRALPRHRRPGSLGGLGRDPVFLATVPLSDHLRIHQERLPDKHGSVEPIRACRPEEYAGFVVATRPRWRKVAA